MPDQPPYDHDDTGDNDAQTQSAPLPPEAMEWVRKTVEELGPLDDEERNFLAQLFTGKRLRKPEAI